MYDYIWAIDPAKSKYDLREAPWGFYFEHFVFFIKVICKSYSKQKNLEKFMIINNSSMPRFPHPLFSYSLEATSFLV